MDPFFGLILPKSLSDFISNSGPNCCPRNGVHYSTQAMLDEMAKNCIDNRGWKNLAASLRLAPNPQPIINDLLNRSKAHLNGAAAHNNPLITMSNFGNSLFAELLSQSIPDSTNPNPGSRQALKALIQARKIRPFASLGTTGRTTYLNCNNWTEHERAHRQELINIVNELKQEAGFWGDVLYPKLAINNDNKIVTTLSNKSWGGCVGFVAVACIGCWAVYKKCYAENKEVVDEEDEQVADQSTIQKEQDAIA